MIKLVKHTVCLVALAASLPANAAILYATAATLTTVWKTATGGDTIRLSGNFGETRLQYKTSSVPITVDATKATFTGTLKLKEVNGLRFIGGTFDSTGGPTAYGKAVAAYGGGNISFDHATVIGRVEDVQQGLSFQGATNVKVTNSTFTNLGVSVAVVSSSNVTLTGNKVIGATKDGFDIYDDHNVLVANNSCSGSHPTAGAHPDCVQLSSTAGHPVQSDIKIIDNIATGQTQGFTSFTDYKGGALRLTITGNIVNGLMPQGIACYGCVDSTITGNYLSGQPGAPHFVNLNVVRGSNNTVADNFFGATAFLPTDYASAYLALTGMTYVSLLASGSSQMTGAEGAVPEPGSWLLMVSGFAAIGIAQRRRARFALA